MIYAVAKYSLNRAIISDITMDSWIHQIIPWIRKDIACQENLLQKSIEISLALE